MDSEDLHLETHWTPWWSRSEAEVLLFLPGLLLLGAGLLKLGGRSTKPGVVAGLAVSGILIGGLLWLTNPPAERAVIVDSSVRLLPTPESGKKGSEVPVGILIEVLESQEHYSKVRFGDEREGWVRSAMLTTLVSR